ncbi:MAG: pilin [Acetobacteraceae bacterium]
MKSVQKGFTLIELMIVVAIIGILAAIAIPAYQNYEIRAQVSEGSSLIGGVETAFDEYYASKGTSAGVTNTTVGLTNVVVGTYVSSVKLGVPGNGQIQVMYGANANSNINGKSVVWTAYQSLNGDITWLCDAESATTAAVAAGGANLEPVTAGVAPADGSIYAINPSYLPTNCK